MKILIADKHDIEAVKNLRTLPNTEVQKYLPEIVKWLQDMNWPVASYVADFLVENADIASPHMDEVIRSDDVIWKHNVLAYVVSKFNDQSLTSILPIVREQVARHELEAEDEDVLEFLASARSLLNRHT